MASISVEGFAVRRPWWQLLEGSIGAGWIERNGALAEVRGAIWLSPSRRLRVMWQVVKDALELEFL